MKSNAQHWQPYGFIEGFWQTLRLVLLVALIYYSRVVLDHYDRLAQGWVQVISITFGALIYVLCLRIFAFFMLHFMKAEQLWSYDYAFLLDSETNFSNMTGCCFFEPFQFEEMKEHILAKTNIMHKCRCKLVSYLGIWFFQKMEIDEWARKKHDVVIEKTGIHTDKQLTDFMAQEQVIRDPYDNCQYKFILIPDFQPGKSAMIVKCHHCFTDGLGLAAFCLALSDDYDGNNLPSIKPPHWLFQMLMVILMPFLVVKGLAENPTKASNIHAFKHDLTPVKGIKSGAFSMDLEIAQIKQICKQRKCSVNDYMVATLGTVLYEYFEKHKELPFETPRKIDSVMPFSFRKPAQDIRDIRMNNDFAGVNVPINVRKDFDDSLQAAMETHNSIKNSITPYCSMAMIKFSVNLPYTMSQYATYDICDKFSFACSNLNASKKPFKFAGKQQLGQFIFIPGVAKLYMTVGFCSTGPFMSVSCYADKERLENPQEIVDLFVLKNKENVGKMQKQE